MNENLHVLWAVTLIACVTIVSAFCFAAYRTHVFASGGYSEGTVNGIQGLVWIKDGKAAEKP